MKGSYSATALATLGKLVDEASGATSGAATVSLKDLEAQLFAVFDAVLGPQNGELKDYWQEAGKRDLPHGDLAALFSEAADAKDPLSIVNLDSFARTQLRSSLRTRWASKVNRAQGQSISTEPLSWDLLSNSQQDDVRDRINNLARFHKSFVTSGAYSKDSLNTILFELATIFIALAKLDIHEYELPHALNSYFIRFAELATQPFFALGVVTPAALANRWKRQKQAHHSVKP